MKAAAAQPGRAVGISTGATVQVLLQRILLLGACCPELRVVLHLCSAQKGNVLVGPPLAARQELAFTMNT